MHPKGRQILVNVLDIFGIRLICCQHLAKHLVFVQIVSEHGPKKGYQNLVQFLHFCSPPIFFISPKRAKSAVFRLKQAKNAVFLLKQAQNVGSRLNVLHIFHLLLFGGGEDPEGPAIKQIQSQSTISILA